jgi:FHA domain-containing protein
LGSGPVIPTPTPKPNPNPHGFQGVSPSAKNPLLDSDIFDDPLAPAPPSKDPFGSAPSPSGKGGLLDDFPDLAGPGLGENALKVDQAFGGAGKAGDLGGDDLINGLLDEPLHQPNTGASLDPLAALTGDVAAPIAAPRSDHLPINQFGFTPPQAVLPAAPMTPAAPVVPVAPVIPVAPITPAAHVAPAAQQRVKVSAVLTPRGGEVAPGENFIGNSNATVVNPRALVPVAPVASGGPALTSSDPLFAALLRGLQHIEQPPPQLTPELMELIGALLREATQGMLHLLMARQEFKQELRAKYTLINPQNNNPLKFSPTVDVALSHLLGTHMRGFMPAREAMHDACNDLRAHQFGVVAGMNAVLKEIIARFAPDQLEKRMSSKSKGLFAANRNKAKLWDQFVQIYAEVAREAQDDSHALFGQALLEAYEAQMAVLKQNSSNS